MKKNTAKHLYLVIGASIGTIIGILAGIFVLGDMKFSSTDLYIEIFLICASLVLISTFAGLMIGLVIGKIFNLLRRIYTKPKPRK